MPAYTTQSPVLFLIFNRPAVTTKVFEAIRKVQPKKLYVAADGPRMGKEGEQELCLQTRAIATAVDWDCEVKTLFRDHNLGCKKAVATAIDWFFEGEPEGIILEDDCLPGNDFFRYCDELLDKYRNDARIMHIGGTNFHYGKQWGEGSYYFSNLCNVWGWASWRRAWQLYDVELKRYATIDSYATFKSIFQNNIIAESWTKIFKELRNGEINTWDYQWTIAILLNHGLTTMPNSNLICNLGLGPDVEATHTHNVKNKIPNHPIGNLEAVLVHPSLVTPQKEADLITLKREFRYKRMLEKKFWASLKFWKKNKK